MPRAPLRLAAVALLLASALLAGCGDDPEPAPEGDTTSDWSDPAVKRARGSPDGETGPRSAADLLIALREVVQGGGGLMDPRYEHAVQAVAAVLFDPEAAGPEAEAAQVHVQVASVAADAGRWIATREGGRAAVEAEHPWDVRVHDAFLEASGGGPEAYRAWCGEAGAALWREFTEARRKALFDR